MEHHRAIDGKTCYKSINDHYQQLCQYECLMINIGKPLSILSLFEGVLSTFKQRHLHMWKNDDGADEAFNFQFLS